ncbi:acyltransferase domain-containing protein [Streptomyces sp. ET3-23]|uniref:ACP S-malonyltransferase n=1 Tax=Streptomyces sp. ET3-23 TaxID=2885643 RepID=UPI001D121272|nr:acyltransferase domain-containing protein [Streptomyces sp. ET3-23]MCC2274026.1 acyltransferase domain-containing protein [Streptomyces sp. ET3-23]
MSIVHLFPGQGDFSLSALLRAARTHRPVRDALAGVLRQADGVAAEFGIRPLGPWLLGSSPPSGRELAAAAPGTPQLALFCSSLAVSRALGAVGLEPERALGVSFGEIAALTAAGVFDVAGGARIACLLARSLARCDGSMLLLQTGEEQTLVLMRAACTRGLALACVNDPGETVVSGASPAVAALERLARRRGVTATRLRLPFLSHHPSLTDEAHCFAASIRRVPAAPARFPVHSAVLGRAYGKEDDVHRGLADCLVRPARVPEVLRQVWTSPVTLLLEAGTGQALTRSTRSTLPAAAAMAHAPLADPGFPWRHPGRLRLRAASPAEVPR